YYAFSPLYHSAGAGDQRDTVLADDCRPPITVTSRVASWEGMDWACPAAAGLADCVKHDVPVNFTDLTANVSSRLNLPDADAVANFAGTMANLHSEVHGLVTSNVASTGTSLTWNASFDATAKATDDNTAIANAAAFTQVYYELSLVVYVTKPVAYT